MENKTIAEESQLKLELQNKIKKNCSHFKQLFSLNLHKDDYQDSIISIGILGSFTRCEKLMCTMYNNPYKIITPFKLVPYTAIGLLAVKNLYYDVDYFINLLKYKNKLTKNNKKHTKKFGVYKNTGRIIDNLDYLSRLTGIKLLSKYAVPISICCGIYFSNNNEHLPFESHLSFVIAFVSSCSYGLTRLAENEEISTLNNLLDCLD